MKIKKGFVLQQIDTEYMAIAVDAGMNGIIKLNAAGKFLWEQLQEDTTEDALVAKVLERFSDADEATVRTDIREFLTAIRVAIE